MVGIEAEVFSPAEQKDHIKQATSRDTHIALAKRYFNSCESGPYISAVNRLADQEELFGLMSLNVILFAQYGMPQLDGLVMRYHKKGWKKPLFGWGHQVALACYGGSINHQLYPTRLAQAEQVAKIAPEAQWGVWRIYSAVENGKVNNQSTKPLDVVIEEALDCLDSQRAICLPDDNFNAQLAGLNFTGQDAESISDQQLWDEVVPQVQQIVSRWLT